MSLATPFPEVSYLPHEFALLPHPHGHEISCVGKNGVPVTNETEADWLTARRLGITASGFGELVTRSGEPSKSRSKVIEAKVTGIEKSMGFVEALALGKENEPIIAARVEAEYGVKENHWLLAHGETPRFLATPDGLSSELASEYKTSVKSWGQNLYTYYRQIQWQLFVTERQASVFAVLHPHTGAFMAGLVPRDDAEVEFLSTVADEVLKEMDVYAQSLRPSVISPVQARAQAAPKKKDRWPTWDGDSLPF